ncbi:DNA-3-methyladenine glycosylase I [Serratia microhaemolytica]|uniref:DNA-3-methyladenine glycosylase I n=1 Tax=Serratia microhaemolytica TaxID=2675110 RepID=UPI000FDE4808|nr:DNA-3-methyladenine glycosylase I [Serratia microhaemolytica]
MVTRCPWAGNQQLYIDYHDHEWGKPLHDDNRLFEMLILEGMQAGLSWFTVLKKREAFRIAFDQFVPAKVAAYDEQNVVALLNEPAIIRHRGKIEAAINNARCFIELQREYGSFDQFIWRYVDNKPLINYPKTSADVPVTTAISDQISADLKQKGFKFVGSTIIYAFMQAIGMVNDHLLDCCCRE